MSESEDTARRGRPVSDRPIADAWTFNIRVPIDLVEALDDEKRRLRRERVVVSRNQLIIDAIEDWVKKTKGRKVKP